MNVTSDRTYPSKRDQWLVVLIWVAVLAESLGILLSLFSSRCPLPVKIFSAKVGLPIVGLMIWVLYSTAYTLTADRLIVRSGPFRWTIALASIEEVSPSGDVWSSPACSLDRLKIRHRSGWLLISPEDKPAFLRDVAARSPVLEVQGKWVVRRAPA